MNPLPFAGMEDIKGYIWLIAIYGLCLLGAWISHCYKDWHQHKRRR